MEPDDKRSSITESEMIAAFTRGVELPPLFLRIEETLLLRIMETYGGNQDRMQPDAVVETTWEGERFKFIAEFKARSTPKVFADAVRQAQAYAEQLGEPPIIVLPYLAPKQLDTLVDMQISGVDLSGNGVVIVPERLLVYRTGKPNKFRESAPTRFAYRGATSLVARVFLCRPSYESLADIKDEIRKRGGGVSISTISKALKRMEEDIIVKKEPGNIALLQADSLLEKLAANYRTVRVRRKVNCAADIPLCELLAQRMRAARRVLSGRSSVELYAVMGCDEKPVIYTDDALAVLDQWGDVVRRTDRFYDFELHETNGLAVFFDARTKENIPYASPVQTYLECATGDKRFEEVAQQVRKSILEELGG